MRQFNCVGERETHEYIIPVIIDQCAKSNHIKLGNNSFRDFQYAGDAVRMAVELLEKGNFGEVYNMGSETGVQMYDLANMISVLMNGEPCYIETDPARVRPWEIWWLQSDNTKLYNTIEARPQVSLEDALKRTINDYKENGWSYINN
jgi:nucleoside-diphosphate-sugar epimerase